RLTLFSSFVTYSYARSYVISNIFAKCFAASFGSSICLGTTITEGADIFAANTSPSVSKISPLSGSKVMSRLQESIASSVNILQIENCTYPKRILIMRKNKSPKRKTMTTLFLTVTVDTRLIHYLLYHRLACINYMNE